MVLEDYHEELLSDPRDTRTATRGFLASSRLGRGDAPTPTL